MKQATLCILLVFVQFNSDSAADETTAAPEWKAGVASVAITPQEPLRMAGYAARKDPAEGTEQELFAKALVLEDAEGNRTVIITMDLIGVLERLRTRVAERVHDAYGLAPNTLLMNASHTHCGPAYGRDEATEYFDWLGDTLVTLVGNSLDTMAPSSLAYGQARCGFAMNRRTPTKDGVKNHPNPLGPVDHTVPVLRVNDVDGNLRAVVFGYTCHNTTMGFRKWLGDYAGYAQQYLEQDHPEVTAMFLNGCGADQNPYPRSELEYAQRHGRSLATAVEAALEMGQRTLYHQHPLRGPLRCVFDTVELESAKPEKPNCSYPVQVIRFGDDLSMIALGNEVVVDYQLRIKRELAAPDGPMIWVAGYSNAYDNYIASKRVLEEGGYEARCTPWQPSLEERIVGKVHELHKAAQMKP